MLAYETGFKGDTRAILSPKSDFFRYFSTPTPTPTPAPMAGAAPASAPAAP
jgi:membrane protease subunit HflC